MQFAELPQGLDQARAQPVDVGSPLRSGDQVDIAFLDGGAVRQPGQRPVRFGIGALHVAGKRLLRQQGLFAELALQVFRQAFLVLPGLLLALFGDDQRDLEARTQHRLGPQYVTQALERDFRAVEVLRIRPESQAGSRVAAPHVADRLQGRGRLPGPERHVVLVAITLDPHLQFGGKRIHHRHADAMQAA